MRAGGRVVTKCDVGYGFALQLRQGCCLRCLVRLVRAPAGGGGRDRGPPGGSSGGSGRGSRGFPATGVLECARAQANFAFLLCAARPRRGGLDFRFRGGDIVAIVARA